MSVTVENLNEKLAEIAKQQEQAVAQLNALAGAKQMVELLLKELTQDATPKVE